MISTLALRCRNVIALDRIDRLMTRVPMTTDAAARIRNADTRTPCRCDAASIAPLQTLTIPRPMAAGRAITVGGREWPNLVIGHASARAVAAFPGGVPV